MAGAGHGVVVRIVGLPEPRALGDQPLEPLRPLVPKAIDVVAAHLVDRRAARPASAPAAAPLAGAVCATRQLSQEQREGEGEGRLHVSGPIIQSRHAGTLGDCDRGRGRRLAGPARARPAQAPALKDVLKRSAAYVERFQQQLSQIVAEETYAQTVVNTSRLTDSMLLLPSRTLRSDLILVKSAEEERFVELRDVFEVDGKPVRDRQARLERLLGANSPAARQPDRRDHSRRARATTSAPFSATSTRR